jgi:hypothetical protein
MNHRSSEKSRNGARCRITTHRAPPTCPSRKGGASAPPQSSAKEGALAPEAMPFEHRDAIVKFFLIQIRSHQFLLMFGRLLPLVGDRPFGGRHAQPLPRKPSRFFVHAQPVFLLPGHGRCSKRYHNSPPARAIHATRTIAGPSRRRVCATSYPRTQSRRPCVQSQGM